MSGFKSSEKPGPAKSTFLIFMPCTLTQNHQCAVSHTMLKCTKFKANLSLAEHWMVSVRYANSHLSVEQIGNNVSKYGMSTLPICLLLQKPKTSMFCSNAFQQFPGTYLCLLPCLYLLQQYHNNIWIPQNKHTQINQLFSTTFDRSGLWHWNL
jgi:hypothetical protein